MKKKYYEEMIKRYVETFPNEESEMESFVNFIKKTSNDNNLYDRKNINGHITVSGIIISKQSSRVLLLKHKSLQKMLHPGGHIEAEDESLTNAVFREIREETGISQEFMINLSFLNGIEPIDINCHSIPANEKKGERKHVHYDLCYAFLYTGNEQNIQIDIQESESFNWFNMAELSELNGRYYSLTSKIIRLLSYGHRPKIFYDSIASMVRSTLNNAEYKIIVVAHLLPDCFFSLNAIASISPILAIIPKPKSIDIAVREKIEKSYNIIDIARETLLNDPRNEIVKLINNNDNIIVFDIGGYFAEICEKWEQSTYSKIKLIIEDTENGAQKYERTKKKEIPVVSVARSPLKDNEDNLVGQSVLFSADSILRSHNNLVQYMKCAVLGFGKIGKSISLHLLQRGNKPMVYDVNPVKRIESFNNLCSIPSREIIIQSADIIFCATGNRSLDIEDFRSLKNGCFIFSVTSSDDEMDLDYLSEYKREDLKEHIVKYSNSNNYFYLVNNGNAVNFIHNAVMGSFIHLVRAEMLFAMMRIDEYTSPKIYSVKSEDKKNIAQIWLDVFDPENRSFCNIT